MKSYNFEKTKDKSLFRVVDENGDWTHYFHKPSKQYLRAVNYILSSGYAKGKYFNDYLKNHSKEEIEKKLKYAGDKGDRVHKFIEYLFLNNGVANRGTKIWSEEKNQEEMLSAEEYKCIVPFQSFWKRHNPILLGFELATYSLKEKIAGTIDALLILRKECEIKTCPCHSVIGKIGVWDWKSGAGIWDDQGAQLSAYSKGENLEAILKGYPIDYTAILRLGTRHKRTNGYEIELYDKAETKTHWQEFLAAKTISDASYKPFNPEKEIYDIPDNIDIGLKKGSIKVKTNK